MDLNQFEKRNTDQEHVIHAEALGEVEASFARGEMEKIKHKLEIRKKKQKRLKIIFLSLGSLITLLIIFVVYSQYKLYTLSRDEKIVPTAVTTATTGADVIKLLARHVLLPEGEPQIAEVKDVEKLRDTQAFFKNAENGDLIILYPTTIFIYRPAKDIVVSSGDISGLGQTKP